MDCSYLRIHHRAKSNMQATALHDENATVQLWEVMYNDESQVYRGTLQAVIHHLAGLPASAVTVQPYKFLVLSSQVIDLTKGK